jgi:hypothetical protein
MGVITFGGGITIGAGIQADAPTNAPTPNSIVVATINESGSDWYGAYEYTSGYYPFYISDFGTVTSDYFYAVMYQTDGYNNIRTYIALNDGSYTGFTVTNGVIDSDLKSYPRVFTIGGTNYTFTLQGDPAGYYVAQGDPLSLASSVGSTITTVYNPVGQPSLTSNSIIVAQVTSGYNTYYGADKLVSIGYGTIVSDYLKAVVYNSPATMIVLVPGTYTGFTVDSNGLIDGDNSTARIFTINGIEATFSVMGSAPNYLYSNMGDPFLLQSNVGSTLGAIYDPAVQPEPDVSVTFGNGFIDGGYFGNEYGWRDNQFGQGFFHPSASYRSGPQAMSGFWYDSVNNQTYAQFRSGNFYDGGGTSSAVVVITDTTINDSGTLTIDNNGTTVTSSSVTSNAGEVKFVFNGDPFGLQAVGQSFGFFNTNAISYIQVNANRPIATGTIDSGSNQFNDTFGWDNSTGLGSAILVPNLPNDMLSAIYYFGPQGTTIQFVSGTYGSVVVNSTSIYGETSVTVTIDGITQSGTLVSAGPGPKLVVSGDAFSLQSKAGTGSLTVLIVAGIPSAGGGFASGDLTVGYNNMDRYGYTIGMYGTSTITPVSMVDALYYYTMVNDTLIQFVSGTYGSIVISNSNPPTIDGETSVTVTIDGVTQTSTLQPGGPGPVLLIDGDPFSLQSNNGQTLAVSMVAGAGGGGGGTTYQEMGNWSSSGLYNYGNWQVTLSLTTASAELLAALNALTNGSTFSVSDGVYSPTVTVQNISGQPFSQFSAVTIYVGTPSPMPPVNLTMLTSITI